MSIGLLIHKAALATAKTIGIIGRELTKHSPELFLGAGTAFGGYGVVQACRQTLTLDDKIESNIEKLKALHDIPEEERTKGYNKQIWALTTTTGAKIVGHYAEPLVIFAISGGCINKSLNIMTTKYLQEHTQRLAEAATFSRYRDFIRERDGEEVDRQAYYGLKETTVEKEVVDEKGKVKKKKSKEEVVFPRDANGRIVINWTEDNFGYCKKRKIFGNSAALYNYDYLTSDCKAENINLNADGIRTLAQWLIDHMWKHPIPPEAFITVWRNEPLDGTIELENGKIPISYGCIDYGLENDINADFRAGKTHECTLLLNCDLIPVKDEVCL